MGLLDIYKQKIEKYIKIASIIELGEAGCRDGPEYSGLCRFAHFCNVHCGDCMFKCKAIVVAPGLF